MTDYLLRDQAPLTDAEWDQIDAVAEDTARRALVGRRIVPVLGPLGAGVEVVPDYVFRGTERGGLDLTGDDEAGLVRPSEHRFLPIPLLYKDFELHWRDLAMHQQIALPLDTGPVETAANIVARKEDDLIFNGNAALGYEGLLNAKGAQTIAKSDWAEGANPFSDVAKGIEALVAKGFSNRLTLVVGPGLYTQLQR